MYTPKEYFTELVISNYEEWRKNQGSIRLAVNFSLVAYHMYEWLYKYNSDKIIEAYNTENLYKFKQMLYSRCPEFDLLRELGILFKHYAPDHNKTCKSADNMNYYTGFCAGDRVGMPIGQNHRIIGTGVNLSLFEIFFNVMVMWYQIFRELGEID